MSRLFGRRLQLPPAQTHKVTVERDLAVAMPDGAVLLADRYAPAGPSPGAGPNDGLPPLLLVRSPYGRRGVWGLVYGRLFAERGFQVLIQSCRGTFGSGGVFDPFGPDEHDDGLATVEWMRRQPWYPGGFGTAGLSYLGMVQWAIAADAGPDHKAMALHVTTSDFRAPIYQGGVFSLELMLGWVHQVANQERPLALFRQPIAARALAPLMNRLPLRDLDRLATGKAVTCWQDWLKHEERGDAYWKPRQFSATVGRVQPPALFIGGWYDVFLPAQLRDYAALRDAGRAPYLTIGPWRHVDEQNVATGVAESLVWLREHLGGRGGADGAGAKALRASPVRIFVTGADEWRELPEWPPEHSAQRWQLQPGGRLAQGQPPAAAPDEYTYDPADPTPNLAGPIGPTGQARVDNRSLEARPDVLTYTSAPLERDLDVIGEVTVVLFARSDREHTDFFARLCDVDPSGRSLNVCDAIMRLSPGRPSPDADGVRRVQFALWPTAHRFKRGQRLRLQVSSGAHPRYARNPGTGEPPGTAITLVSAHQQVFHDPEHPSAVVLPVAG